jgi:hypothetical protein
VDVTQPDPVLDVHPLGRRALLLVEAVVATLHDRVSHEHAVGFSTVTTMPSPGQTLSRIVAVDGIPYRPLRTRSRASCNI